MSGSHHETSGDGATPLGGNAFLGSAMMPVDGTAFRVHVLCWPSMPTAWRSLAQAWESVGGWRSTLETTAKRQTDSWIAACAPQLGWPFRGTTAEESTIAAILRRTAMCLAVSVLDGAQVASADRRQGLLHCLSAYDKYVRVPGRRSCGVLISRRDAADTDAFTDAFIHCRKRLPDAEWLRHMELRSWSTPIEPLPLEAAHVIATSIARYRRDKDVENPVVDAIRAKLTHPLDLLVKVPKKRH
ncbi:MAG TPA: hypothetical protein VFB32_05955 [Rudaea sp.]|nr:hypothetical protein [Rudaea sp.]